MSDYNNLTEDEEKRHPVTPYISSHLSRTFWFQNDDDAVTTGEDWQASRHKLHCFYTSPHFYYSITILLILSVCIIQFTSQHHLRSYLPPSDGPSPLCGSSPEEARAIGCTFDVYVNGWLPAACYDRAVAEQSESNSSDLHTSATGRTTFPVYWDEGMTEPATLEDVMLAAFENGEDGYNVRFHTVWEYHRAHCLHLWRLAASALQRLSEGKRDVGVYYKAASPEHVWHCNKVIIEGDARSPEKKDTITPGIGRCVWLGNLENVAYR
ncbi:hypothetical protein CDEST_12916 [Colletotrichum destructivum]|uniref:Uncharacterized protein n=1 Tax=Colletotrichum destructivum TaxID=34406 RepID=A0AAX4IXS8_9PEZI|nr:hypothetical protein CDEST_12916 [Colletotrichum destructivum]